jgi:hypothetical protein
MEIALPRLSRDGVGVDVAVRIVERALKTLEESGRFIR